MNMDPEQDVTDTVEYDHGFRWASQNASRLIELFSSNNLSAPELRTKLWKVADGEYPSKRGEMKNELRQTRFVLGAIRRLIDAMPNSLESFREIFEIGMELGAVYSAEKWKLIHLETLRKKDASWWRKKKGDASPSQVVSALSNLWWNTHAKEKGVNRTTKWEILIDTLSAREMCALASLENITHNKDGKYKTYDVEGDGCDFQMTSDLVYDGGRVISFAGEIVG